MFTKKIPIILFLSIVTNIKSQQTSIDQLVDESSWQKLSLAEISELFKNYPVNEPIPSIVLRAGAAYAPIEAFPLLFSQEESANRIIGYRGDITTPLLSAIAINNPDRVQKLIEQKAHVNAIGQTQAPLHRAASLGLPDIVKALLSHSEININHQEPATKETALFAAIKAIHEKKILPTSGIYPGYRETIKILLDNNANPNIPATINDITDTPREYLEKSNIATNLLEIIQWLESAEQKHPAELASNLQHNIENLMQDLYALAHYLR